MTSKPSRTSDPKSTTEKVEKSIEKAELSAEKSVESPQLEPTDPPPPPPPTTFEQRVSCKIFCALQGKQAHKYSGFLVWATAKKLKPRPPSQWENEFAAFMSRPVK